MSSANEEKKTHWQSEIGSHLITLFIAMNDYRKYTFCLNVPSENAPHELHRKIEIFIHFKNDLKQAK